ncbi:F-box only protein 32-like [Diadema antillarum]|uniref:F-box only protein 32-like n=1 Tax=Diadema antillarum TaxID=105358 RepID=UPI003A836397
MPFLGRDWRAPGNEWVKNTSGWERIVILRENLNRHIKKIAQDRLLAKNWQLASEVNQERVMWDQSRDGDLSNTQFWKRSKRPTFRKLSQYIFLPKGRGREKTQYITVGEVLLKLDFCSALHQLSRFNYVCRFLDLVIQNHYSSLSGSALKSLFSIVEEAVNVALETKYNVNQVRQILRRLITALQMNTGGHIGGKAGWNCHYQITHVWLNQLKDIQYDEEEPRDDGLLLTDLPPECLRQIFARMQDHCDIVHTGEASKLLHQLSEEWLLWRDFCHFHFTPEQMMPVVPKNTADHEVKWKQIYKRLRVKHGKKEVFADQLQLCCHCCCLFWMGGTHPCSIEIPLERGERAPEHQVAKSKSISPSQLSDMFPMPR